MSDREKLIDLICDYCEHMPHEEGQTWEEACADHLIANGVTVQKWIPVSERLPKYREDVLVTDGKSVCTAWLSKSNVWIRSYTSAILDGFTNWMPMPYLPTEEEK